MGPDFLPAGAAEAKTAKPLFVEKPSPVAAAKAVKNETELAGMREAHLRDAVALAETLLHLEQEVGPHRRCRAAYCFQLCTVALEERLFLTTAHKVGTCRSGGAAQYSTVQQRMRLFCRDRGQPAARGAAHALTLGHAW